MDADPPQITDPSPFTRRPPLDQSPGFEAVQLLGTASDDDFDLLARIASESCGTEMAGVTFVSRDRQHFKAALGHSVEETARDEPFCRDTIASDGPTVVRDAGSDDRFRDSPLVTDAGVRFYAGAPLRSEGGSVFGVLCVMDSAPRELDGAQMRTLTGLARQATVLIERRRDQDQLARLGRRLGHDERLAHVAAWEWNAETGRVVWSAQMNELLGVGPEVLGSVEGFMERLHKTDRRRVEETVLEAQGEGTPFAYRARIVRPDGEVRTIDTQGEALLDSTGHTVGLHGATVDVTELVEAEMESRERAMGLYAAFDAALDPILVVNEGRRFEHANQAACDLLGYSRDQLLGMRLEELTTVKAPERLEAAWKKLRSRGELRGEVELRCADGSETIAEFSATANFVPNRHLVVLHDTSERRRSEMAVRDSNRRLRETQALAMVGSWEWNLEEQLEISSPELLRILGRSPESGAPTYEEFVSYVHPEDREAYDLVAARAVQDQQPFHQIFRIVSEAGETRTIESHGRVEVNEDGTPKRMYGAAQDITERERTEDHLRMQAEVLDQLPAAIVATGTNRKITQWNGGARAMFGIPAEEAIGRVFGELGLIPPGSHEVREQMVTSLAEQTTWEGEIDLNDADGRVFPAFLTNSPTRNERGEIVGYVGVMMDRTDQRRAETEMSLQGKLLDQVDAAVIGLDPERRVTHWNRGAERLTGWSRAEACGLRLDQIGLVDPDATQSVAEARDQLSTGGAWEGEIQMSRKDGSPFPTLTSISPTVDEKGELTGFVGVAVDITVRKRAEEDARRARLETLKRLTRAVETRDPETGGHIERIGEIAGMLAERLGLSAEQVELIRVSSPMHDVGKIGVPDAVLLKPGKLTAGERAEMELHAQLGHDILAGSDTELLDMAASIALTHHERVDGTGYPNGLEGDQIPIEGRIVAVADVFDALTSDRVYRKAISIEVAVEIMREGRDSHFDPRVLDLLLDDLEAFVAVKRADPSEISAQSPGA